MTIAIIGDIGGHARELRTALHALGADPHTLRLPADLTVVQVGDLVHRGPDSTGALDVVATIRRAQPDQWVQLIGNHEGLYLGGTRFSWPDPLCPTDAARLRDWHTSGVLRLAAAVRTADYGDLLITHAGLTSGLWRELDCPTDAATAAARLNALPHTDPARAWRAGCKLGLPTNLAAGPVWASAPDELYPSWLLAEQRQTDAPYGQVHGHSTAADWTGRPVRLSPHLSARLTVDAARRHTLTHLGGRAFFGIDPGLGRRGGVQWAPLLLPGATLLPAPALPPALSLQRPPVTARA